MEKAKNFIPLILVLILSFLTIRPILDNGYFPMHDDTQPSRIFEMANALKDGQFPVRWVGDLGYGYGYPIFNFYAPLPFYIGAIGVIFGIGTIETTKLMFAAGMLLAGLTMYWLGEKIWGKWGGLLTAILYIFAPYHAVDLYVRGAAGELWAYGFLPLVGLGVWFIKNSISKKGILIGGVGLAGVILSHNITGMLTIGFLSIWVLGSYLLSREKINPVGIISLVGLGLGLAAFFWLPALVEAPLTNVASLTQGTNDFHNHFVYLDQLWNSPWGFGGSAPGRLDGMSFMIGKIEILLGIAGIFYLFYRNKKGWRNWEVWGLVSLLAVSVFMMLSESQKLWEILPFSGYIQYPWRFLLYTDFFTAILGGSIVSGINKQGKIWKRGIISGLIILTVVLNTKYFQRQFLYQVTDADYISENNLKWKISKISDEYLPRDFPVPQKEEDIPQEKFTVPDDIIVEQSEVRSHFYKLVVSANYPAEILINTAYFPGWRTVVDTVKQPVAVRNGLMTVQLPAGKHIVTAEFENTWIRILGNWISILSGVILIYLLIKLKIEFDNGSH